MKLRKSNLCVLCGVNLANTREHVPPENLFEKPKPLNLITVPACDKCNGSFKLDDEYFRIAVACIGDPSTSLGSLWRNKVVGSTFKRSPALLTQLAKDRENVLTYAATNGIRTYDDRVLPEEDLSRVQTFDATRINRVISKIISGLHFHQFGSILPVFEPKEVIICPVDDEKANEIIGRRSGNVGSEYQFSYLCEKDVDEEWCLLFFNQLAVIVKI